MILTIFILHSILLFILFILVEVKKVGGKPLLAIGALVDISYNWTWAILMFLQIPRELFFSQRVNKNKSLPCFRGSLARFICTNILNRFLPNHCKE